MVNPILHHLLRREVLVLHQRILLVRLEVAAVVRHPQVFHRVVIVRVILYLWLSDVYAQPVMFCCKYM